MAEGAVAAADHNNRSIHTVTRQSRRGEREGSTSGRTAGERVQGEVKKPRCWQQGDDSQAAARWCCSSPSPPPPEWPSLVIYYPLLAPLLPCNQLGMQHGGVREGELYGDVVVFEVQVRVRAGVDADARWRRVHVPAMRHPQLFP